MANILVVDDDKKLADQIAKALVAGGHACRAEYSAEAAFQVLDGPIDLVILDIMLPGVSGFEVCRRVRANGEHFAMPILFLSAIDSQEEITHGLAQGADDYITKPFQMASLIRRAEALLAQNTPAGLVDPLTELAGPKAIKLELQRGISRKAPFVVAYIEIPGLTEYARAAGNEERARAVRHLGRMLHVCGKDLSVETFHVGHLGGGHFIATTDADAMRAYIERVRAHWDEHTPKLTETMRTPARTTTGVAAPGLNLGLLICTAHCPARGITNARELFEALTHVRQSALAQGPGVYSDRRL